MGAVNNGLLEFSIKMRDNSIILPSSQVFEFPGQGVFN